MSDQPHSPTPASDAASLMPRFARRYVAVLAAVACLVVLDQAVLQPLLMRLNGFAPVINLAGRQRMLSQKLTKTALAIRWSPDGREADRRREELTGDLATWRRVHAGLLHGDGELDLSAARSDDVRAAFARLEGDVAAMQAAAMHIASGTPAAPGAEPDARLADAVDVLLASEARYLPQMDRIVGLFERDARRQVTQLRLFAVSIMAIILLLLGGLGRFVVRPATRLIRGQFDQLARNESALCAARDDLERRVAERTRQLSETNAALRSEMSEREQAEQRARQVLGQLAHVSRVRVAGQLATGLAHELNQPLGTIANATETVELLLDREPRDVEAIHGSLRRIRDSSLRAGAIVRRMRDFVRPAARDRIATDLNALVAEAAELCAAECRQADVSVALNLSPKPLPADVDPIQIQQVLVNLIQNAIHALRETPQEVRRLVLHTRRDGLAAIVAVEDRGPGFSVDPETACGAFYSTRPEGLGLGLAISRSIIQDHSGRLWIDSLPGRGARVLASLPLTADSTSDRDATTNSAHVAPAETRAGRL